MQESIIKQIRLLPEKPLETKESDPFLEDRLGFKDSVIRLSQILQQIETPFTMAIYGGWGTGKTSFMRMLKAYMNVMEESKDKFDFFWFDAWKYENESSLLLPFLSLMGKDFPNHRRVIRKVTKIGAAVLLSGIDAVLRLTKLKALSINSISKNLKLCENQIEIASDSWVSNIDLLRDEFQKLVTEITKSNKKFVVFIDDLDRCMPENVVKLIEDIRHFLSVENTVFIIGVDRDVLAKGIQARYKSSFLISGEEYLEKIINISFDLPSEQEYENNDFVLETARKLTELSFYEQIKDELLEFNKTICVLGSNNPRKLRKLTLRYLFFLTLPDYKEYIREIVIKLIVFKELFPDAYQAKRTAGLVNYFPVKSSSEFEKLLWDSPQITRKDKEDGCPKGFLNIVLEPRYYNLGRFSRKVEIQIKAFNKNKASIESELNSGNKYSNHENRTAISELISSKYKTYHSEYFKLIDFIFSLS